MSELDRRIVSQRETPPPHTGGWTVTRDVTEDLEELRAVLDRLVDPHQGSEISPQREDIEHAQTLINTILGDSP